MGVPYSTKMKKTQLLFYKGIIKFINGTHMIDKGKSFIAIRKNIINGHAIMIIECTSCKKCNVNFFSIRKYFIICPLPSSFFIISITSIISTLWFLVSQVYLLIVCTYSFYSGCTRDYVS